MTLIVFDFPFTIPNGMCFLQGNNHDHHSLENNFVEYLFLFVCFVLFKEATSCC